MRCEQSAREQWIWESHSDRHRSGRALTARRGRWWCLAGVLQQLVMHDTSITTLTISARDRTSDKKILLWTPNYFKLLCNPSRQRRRGSIEHAQGDAGRRRAVQAGAAGCRKAAAVVQGVTAGRRKAAAAAGVEAEPAHAQ
ncbi:hypothetical protein GGX14DRAFT_390129 [Mycena pura]|uniref:Uncharacterized protein n=1 Tax=Mycena pura TaxID=153505 RepID=A0AAD6YHU9_9AGAR|nr:hypothetical protein GGX14DRAFT_390129 [Mycena pura]